MGYGLEVTGANDSFVIDSSISGAAYMPIVQGNTSCDDGNVYSNYTLGDLIYARPASGSGMIFTDFGDPDNPEADGDQHFVLLRTSSTAPSTSQNGSNYGLKVLDEVVGGSQAVMYDSRHTASTVDIKASKGIKSLPGGISGYNGTPTESTENQIYTSYNSNTYALMNGQASILQGYMKIKLGYHFKASTTIIYYVGYYQWSGFGNQGSGPVANFGTILVGDLVT